MHPMPTQMAAQRAAFTAFSQVLTTDQASWEGISTRSLIDYDGSPTLGPDNAPGSARQGIFERVRRAFR